ncbi:MAG: flavin reductase family protein [Fidelibacterota bacterium]|nr:MAG: flavin reductase family protein [Candidatus Neomarinimicrobiota bacterium]
MKKSLGAVPIVYPTPVFIVGTYDDAGKPNVMAVSWGGICCTTPPCVSISLRKATYSYQGLLNRKAFTISLPSEAHIAAADYFGTVSGRKTDKFADTGLTPVRSDLVDAPYVKEFPFILECKVIQVHEIGLHTQFIGEIVDIKADESILDDHGQPNIQRIKPFLYAPQQAAYYGIGIHLGEAYSIGETFTKKER